MRHAVRMGLVGVWIGVAAAVGACEKPAVTPVAASIADSAEITYDSMVFFLSDSMFTRAKVYADSAFQMDQGNRLELRRMHIIYFGGGEKGDSAVSTLDAEEGRYLMQEKTLEARGRVVIVSPAHGKLSTEHIHYDQNTDVIVADTTFLFEDGERSGRGGGFTTNSKVSNFVCHGSPQVACAGKFPDVMKGVKPRG